MACADRHDAGLAVGRATAHDSAAKHVTGEAVYVDDIAAPEGTLEVHIALSPHAHARIEAMDLDAVRADPEAIAVLTAADIPGVNDVAPVSDDDPLLAEDIVEYAGQPVFAVVARTRALARAAAERARVDYEPLPALVTIDEAMAAGSYVLETRTLERGDWRKALQSAPHRVSGRLAMGGQDHLYLEGQAALALPAEDGDMVVHSSSQHPSEIQHLVAGVLGLRNHAVNVKVRRMGGGFGGKETQAAGFAALAALAARITGRPVKVVADRDDDMLITGKRHDFQVRYEAGFDDRGRLLAVDVTLASRCGRSADLSGPVNDRAVFHVDNAYFLEHVRIRSYRCRTHTVSNTAFRGFGGPQGMMAIEQVMDHVARELGRDPLEVRRINLYGQGKRNLTPYGMTVEDNILPELIGRLVKSADYAGRRTAIDAFNAGSPVLKKGLALTPVKFGISFTSTHLNQAGALVHVYSDGSIHLNHGGTEMGQGLMIKVAQVVAEEFQVPLDRIRISETATDKVPNTSATAASSGADLNGKAAQVAARTLRQRLVDFAAAHYGIGPDQVEFTREGVRIGDRIVAFAELARQAWMGRVSLSATGYYRTPKIAYDPATGKGRPFYYFAYGAAVSEVIIDTLTGEMRVERVDLLHDCGDSLNPAIDLGQIEGGFIQGMGWLTSEELFFDDDGHLMTHAPSTYKIPTAGDRPPVMRMALVEDSPNRERAIYRSKAVGEPPLMLAISVFRAVSDAVRAAGDRRGLPRLDAPATPERILAAVTAQREGSDDRDPVPSALATPSP